MTRLSAHFDGHVIIPDEPINLPADTRLIVQIESEAPGSDTLGMDGDKFIGFAKSLNFDAASLNELEQAIHDGCEKVDPDGW